MLENWLVEISNICEGLPQDDETKSFVLTQCKLLEERLEQLEARINEGGVAISQNLEKDILTTIGGKNLEAISHANRKDGPEVPSSNHSL